MKRSMEFTTTWVRLLDLQKTTTASIMKLAPNRATALSTAFTALLLAMIQKKVFAGYFAGRLGIGTAGNDYVLPDTRGAADQVLTTDANGLVTWKYPNSGTYASTASGTGAFPIPPEAYSLRINNQVSSILIPDAATNKGRLIYLLNWPGNTRKTLDFTGTNDLFDITTNSSVNSIEPGQKYLIQSAGNRWILLDK